MGCAVEAADPKGVLGCAEPKGAAALSSVCLGVVKGWAVAPKGDEIGAAPKGEVEG